MHIQAIQMKMMKGPSGPGRSAQEAATIDHGDPARLGIDHQSFGDAIARKGDDVTRIEREHLLVALEPGAGTKPTIKRVGQLLDFAAFSPARGEAIGTLAVAAMNQEECLSSEHLAQLAA
jgi:hypothetical protein